MPGEAEVRVLPVCSVGHSPSLLAVFIGEKEHGIRQCGVENCFRVYGVSGGKVTLLYRPKRKVSLPEAASRSRHPSGLAVPSTA